MTNTISARNNTASAGRKPADTNTANAATADTAKPLIMAERFKTRLCKTFRKTGSCAYELRCMFAHGKADLRTEEQNERDGLTSEEAVKAWQREREREAAAQKLSLPEFSPPVANSRAPPPSVSAHPAPPARAYRHSPYATTADSNTARMPVRAVDMPASPVIAECPNSPRSLDLNGEPMMALTPALAAVPGGYSPPSYCCASASKTSPLAVSTNSRSFQHNPYSAVPIRSEASGDSNAPLIP